MSDRSGGLEKPEADAGLRDLYRLYSGWLTARLRRRHGDEADDLVQEAWLRITPYSRRGAIERPKALLMSIVTNLVIDRSRRDRPQPLRPDERPASEVFGQAADQTEAVLLKAIIVSMPDNLREVFVLSRFVCLTYDEIAERLEIPVSTVQWRMSQAMNYCAAQLRL